MQTNTNHKVFTGTVVSHQNDKTITVLVTTYKKHPLYSKRVISSKKFRAHDEKNEAHTGDIVRITECRPLSRTKRFRLTEIVEKHEQVL
jgi:small subunit ribosomal protein S17